MTNILGISAYYHDSAAALVCDGEIVAAAQEERFSRRRHDATFPRLAAGFCLAHARLAPGDIDCVVFYDKPLLKFERLLETYLTFCPRGFRSFLAAMPVWLKEKLYLKRLLRQEIARLGPVKKADKPRLLFTEHHQAHAASAFFPSPFASAAVLCMDGVGEWATTSAWLGEDNRLQALWQINFPHSLGLLYSAFTWYAGFRVNSGEYKLMGLAPYGKAKYQHLIMQHLLDLKDDGSFHLNMDYFNFATGLTMAGKRFEKLFGGPPRSPESPLTQRDMDIAASIQAVTEEIILRTARTLRVESGCEYLCLAGGVALNCVANGSLLRENIFRDIWIQPAGGDAGGAIGSALAAWHEYYAQPRQPVLPDRMAGSYLGPAYTDDEVKQLLDLEKAVYRWLEDEQLYSEVAGLLADGKVVGWFQGRMEFGPRALGGRSILADPRNRQMQSLLNLKIKQRESFRPFAPSVLAERAEEYFDLDRESPYMLMVADVREAQRLPIDPLQQALSGLDKLSIARSTIPAVTHVDCSARVQTVSQDDNPRYYALIRRFDDLTGCPLLVNTSFNVRGEPIVCTPRDAWRCFMGTGMDYLAVGNYLLGKAEQPADKSSPGRDQEFELD